MLQLLTASFKKVQIKISGNKLFLGFRNCAVDLPRFWETARRHWAFGVRRFGKALWSHPEGSNVQFYGHLTLRTPITQPPGEVFQKNGDLKCVTLWVMFGFVVVFTCALNNGNISDFESRKQAVRHPLDHGPLQVESVYSVPLIELLITRPHASMDISPTRLSLCHVYRDLTAPVATPSPTSYSDFILRFVFVLLVLKLCQT